METQSNNDGFLADSPGDLKAKSSFRLHYEAQVEVIRKQIGDLEKIRENLGLSQRKICQLLMVDPSAWTRWTKKGEKAPPHIYRALQWYMILQEKLPGLTPQYFVGKDPEVLHRTALQHIQNEAQKRAEFEEAFSFQTMSMERQIQDLLKNNRELSKSKKELESKIESHESRVKELQAAIIHNRIGFFLLAIGGLVMAFAVYWQFLR